MDARESTCTRYPRPVSAGTRDLQMRVPATREWGRGFGRVAKCLPRPVPTYTLPTTRAGLPHPCDSLDGVDMGH